MSCHDPSPALNEEALLQSPERGHSLFQTLWPHLLLLDTKKTKTQSE